MLHTTSAALTLPAAALCPAPQGGTLVVCPTTVLHQWASEIKTKVNPHAGINVHVYHGKGEQTLLAAWQSGSIGRLASSVLHHRSCIIGRHNRPGRLLVALVSISGLVSAIVLRSGGVCKCLQVLASSLAQAMARQPRR